MANLNKIQLSFENKVKKGTNMNMTMSKQEIFEKAMEEASKVFGVDPAYFGKEGEEEVERQLKIMGYSLEDLRE